MINKLSFCLAPLIGTTSASSMFTQVLRKLSFSRFIPFFHYLIFNVVPVNRHHLVYIRTYLLFGLKGIPTTSTASCSQKNDIRLRIFPTKIYFENAGWKKILQGLLPAVSDTDVFDINALKRCS